MARATIRKSGATVPGAPAGDGTPVVPWHMDALGRPRHDETAGQAAPVRPPEEELARIREQARAEAHAAGLAAGLAAGADRISELAQLLGRLREVMEDHEQALAGDVMGLAVELSRQILRHTLHVHPEVVLPVVREAIASLPQGSQHPRLLLHPQDAALVRSVLDANQLTPAPWRIVEDSRLERGGCRIETASNELDASLGSRWRAVIASLGREERWTELDASKGAGGAVPAAGDGPSGTMPSAAPGASRPREPR